MRPATATPRSAAGACADEAGGAALQFAMVLPMLVAILFGGFQLALGLYSGSAVRSAVQRSSRLIMADPATTDAQLQTAVRGLIVSVPVTDVTVTTTRETVTATQAVRRVAWTYSYMLNTPFVPATRIQFDSSIVVPLAPTT